jgi:hypothetical protein
MLDWDVDSLDRAVARVNAVRPALPPNGITSTMGLSNYYYFGRSSNSAIYIAVDIAAPGGGRHGNKHDGDRPEHVDPSAAGRSTYCEKWLTGLMSDLGRSVHGRWPCERPRKCRPPLARSFSPWPSAFKARTRRPRSGPSTTSYRMNHGVRCFE